MPGEPDERDIAQRGHQYRNRGYRRNLMRLKGFHGIDVGCGAHRMFDHRADVGHDVQIDARRPQRHHDVGKQDGGIDAVAAHRLQRDLAHQLGIETAASMLCCVRSSRYSGSERPACRMNHTGTRLGLRPPAAARYGDSGSSRRVFIGTHACEPLIRRAARRPGRMV